MSVTQLEIFCPPKELLVEQEINHVLTQYRESPYLLHVIRTYLGQVVDVLHSICNLPAYFDLDSAVGEQLTFVGERMGWPRCHCVCQTQPVFGFPCEGFPDEYTLTGFCDEMQTWLDCGPFIDSDICLEDDELYRTFLKVRRYQMLGLYSLDDLTTAIQSFWGPTAHVIASGNGRVVIAPGRELTIEEKAVLQLIPRVLPVAPGIRVRFSFQTGTIFGFGNGWGEFCEEHTDLVLSTREDVPIGTENDEIFVTGLTHTNADWLCEVDVKPYDCATVG